MGVRLTFKKMGDSSGDDSDDLTTSFMSRADDDIVPNSLITIWGSIFKYYFYNEVPDELEVVIKEKTEEPRFRQFIIFAWGHYYPGGGLKDVHGSFSTYKLAEAEVKSLIADGWDHVSIVDRDTWKILKEIKS